MAAAAAVVVGIFALAPPTRRLASAPPSPPPRAWASHPALAVLERATLPSASLRGHGVLTRVPLANGSIHLFVHASP